MLFSEWEMWFCSIWLPQLKFCFLYCTFTCVSVRIYLSNSSSFLMKMFLGTLRSFKFFATTALISLFDVLRQKYECCYIFTLVCNVQILYLGLTLFFFLIWVNVLVYIQSVWNDFDVQIEWTVNSVDFNTNGGRIWDCENGFFIIMWYVLDKMLFHRCKRSVLELNIFV